MPMLKYFQIFFCSIFTAGCSSYPPIEETMPSAIKLMYLDNDETPILSMGWQMRLDVKNGCLSVNEMPIITTESYEIRNKKEKVFLFKNGRPIAKLGDKVNVGGHYEKKDRIRLYAEKILCESDNYFIVDDISRA